jgi:hypothetical protein
MLLNIVAHKFAYLKVKMMYTRIGNAARKPDVDCCVLTLKGKVVTGAHVYVLIKQF